MSEAIERIKSRWAREGIAIRPGNSPEVLTAFEAKYGVVLPTAVRDYFAAVDGTGDAMDDGCFRFWPLAEVTSIDEYHGGEPEEDNWATGWFLFMDHLINSFFFAVWLTADRSSGGAVGVPHGPRILLLAPNFEEFLELYAADTMNLYGFSHLVDDIETPGNGGQG